MKANPILFLLATGFILLNSCGVQKQQQAFQPKADLLQIIDKNLQFADKQYQFLMKETPENRLPRTIDKNGKLVTSDSEWWCSGFYPGTLFYLYELTNDKILYDEGLSRLKLLEKEQFNTRTHDLGFMMYCSFGNANRIKPEAGFKTILINSARSLASRFDENTGCIRSWNSKDPAEFKVIIDNMMNLELLFWATKATGDSSFYKIAVSHANTTMKNHFRPDYSTWHLVIYDGNTGEVRRKQTVQGYADNSSWARGQSWGLYGYTMMYRETKNPAYLEQANHIAEFILNHPHLPADKVPYWDFDAPDIPRAYRDASAGALMASALLELAQYNTGKVARNYRTVAETILRTLSSPEYLADVGENGGFLLKHSVGNLPGKSEVDVPLTYADYYFVEAMLRYKALAKK